MNSVTNKVHQDVMNVLSMKNVRKLFMIIKIKLSHSYHYSFRVKNSSYELREAYWH